MEVCYRSLETKNKEIFYLESGICGRLELSSSCFSRTDCVSRSSSLDMATITMLQIINNAAIIEVNLVRKLPTDLADVKLSCETPKPNAPPSDFCNNTEITRITAKMMFIPISKDSIMTIYSNSLLYQ
tara:strand:+ start:1588 stop:1971 length:384 start_codon:yes stop_codon:yes gene_type:complete